MKNMVRVFLLLCLVAALAACQTMGGAFGTRKYNPRIQLQVGEKYFYHNINKFEINAQLDGLDAEIFGSEMNMCMQTDVSYRLEVLEKLSNHSWRLSFKGENVAIGVCPSEDSPSQEPTSAPELEQLLSAMTHSNYSFVFDRDGKVSEVEGFDQTIDKLSTALENFDIQTARKNDQESTAMAGKLILDNYIKDLHFLPDKPMKLGDTWVKQIETELGDKRLIGESSYTMSKWEDEIAHFDIHTTYALPPLVVSNEVEVMEKAWQSGSLAVNSETGMLVSLEIKTNLLFKHDNTDSYTVVHTNKIILRKLGTGY
ncbi:MAG TPA: DUF6263 family protein [bacterium]|nr:DUF6263 family protein [bacterium]